MQKPSGRNTRCRRNPRGQIPLMKTPKQLKQPQWLHHMHMYFTWLVHALCTSVVCFPSCTALQTNQQLQTGLNIIIHLHAFISRRCRCWMLHNSVKNTVVKQPQRKQRASKKQEGRTRCPSPTHNKTSNAPTNWGHHTVNSTKLILFHAAQSMATPY